MENKRRRAISSSIGKVNMGDSQGRPEVLTVEDFSTHNNNDDNEIDYNNPYHRAEMARRAAMQVEENDPVEENQKLKQLKEEKDRAKAGRAAPEAISRFEVCAGISRLTRDVSIGEDIYVIRSLKSREYREVMTSILNCTNKIDEMYSLRANTMARAIVSINGHSIESLIGNNDVQKKVEYIDEFDEVILQHLYEQYDDMIAAHKKATVVELGSNSKEILDNLKKS